MTKAEIIEYLYENHVHGDLKIEDMAEDLSVDPVPSAQPRWIPCKERMPLPEPYKGADNDED